MKTWYFQNNTNEMQNNVLEMNDITAIHFHIFVHFKNTFTIALSTSFSDVQDRQINTTLVKQQTTLIKKLVKARIASPLYLTTK